VSEGDVHGAPRPEAGDPGKEWRSQHGIPVVAVFDGFRALAIMSIVVFHVFQFSGLYGSLGDSFAGAMAWALPSGIIGLFIISGFVVFMPTVASRGDFGGVGRYAIRRAARILPAYWAVLVIAILLLSSISDAAVPGAGSIAAHFALLETPAQLVSEGVPLGLGVVPPVWTLSIELIFYVTLPLIATAYFRRPLIGLGLALALTVIWQLVATNAAEVASAFGLSLSTAAESRIDTHFASQFPAWAFAFACGMTGAWAYVRVRERSAPGPSPARPATLVVAGSAIALVLFLYLNGHRTVTDPTAITTPSLPLAIGMTASMAALFVALALAPSAQQAPFANRPIRRLADISYGIYLIHFAVIWLAVEFLTLSRDGSIGALLVWAAIVIPASIAYGYVSARFLERPIRRWAHRFGRRAEGGVRLGGAGLPDPAPTAPSPSAGTPNRT
jgi:peptidoglycan/LPS O-acetylase OafA/YrhL